MAQDNVIQDERLRKKSEEAYRLRKAGTHVHHSLAHLMGGDADTGLIEIEKAKNFFGRVLKGGGGGEQAITPEQFYGDPDHPQQIVRWSSTTVTAPVAAPGPTG
jgi:hypothetical protein